MQNIEQSRKELLKIKSLIKKYDVDYYTNALSEVTDYEYDQLLKRLSEIEKEFPELIDSDSPTIKVGSDLDNTFKKINHSTKMLSISNTYSKEELYDFDKKIVGLLHGAKPEYVAELKIDGVAIALRYQKGRLVSGITRGDGIVGDDVTSNVKAIKEIPQEVNILEDFEVRGEIYMDHNSFENINKKLPDGNKMQNPRNAAAGSLKLHDPNVVAKRELSFLAYYLVSNKEDQYHYDNMKRLEKMGFPVNYMERCGDIEEVIQFCDMWDTRRAKLGYDIDGVVIKVNSIRLQNILGTTSKSPRWVVAYKYKPESVVTKVLKIDNQVGRTGVVTPVAKLSPILISGSTVSNATLHNYDEIERLDVRVGDYVYVEKGGEIIPKITGVDLKKRPKDSKVTTALKYCPICKEELVKDEVALRCDNISCPAQIQRSIEHFVSRGAVNIEDIGPSLITQLLDENIIYDWADIYKLNKELLCGLTRMGDKSADNVINAIEKSKNVSLDNLIFGIGIRYVGIGTARILASNINSLWDLKEWSFDSFLAINEIGEKTAKSILNWFRNESNIAKLKKLETLGVLLNNKKNIPDSKKELMLNGKIFVITGKLKKYSRLEIESLIRNNGGKTSSSISKKTDYLLAGENAGSKLKKAEKLSVKIIDENDFWKLIKK